MERFATVVLLILNLTSPVVTAQTDDKTVIDKFIAAQAKREWGSGTTTFTLTGRKLIEKRR